MKKKMSWVLLLCALAGVFFSAWIEMQKKINQAYLSKAVYFAGTNLNPEELSEKLTSQKMEEIVNSDHFKCLSSESIKEGRLVVVKYGDVTETYLLLSKPAKGGKRFFRVNQSMTD